MRWTRSKLKTLLDEARKPGKTCPAAARWIEKLDKEYQEKPRRKKQQRKSGIDRFLDWLMQE